MRTRSTVEVFEDHLKLRAEGRGFGDLKRNYAENLVILHESGVFRGLEGLRHSEEELKRQLPQARFKYRVKRTEGDYALLIWQAEAETHRVEDGADSFVIKDGKIVMQTIFYRLLPK
jgi:hypothetical protein